jgi:pimeloyl-ACP methyl ester carboxylesterase
MRTVLYSLLTALMFGCSNSNSDKPQSFAIGFKSVHGVDRSREYKPGTDSSDYLHFRPEDIDVWYPASASAQDTILAFRDILGLFDKRANYYTASTAGNGLSQQVAQLFCTGFHCSDSATLLNFKTNSRRNALPSGGKFPLVIYFSAYNGMSYENYTLFEDLASHGFVVVSISSIGRYPGDMTMKKEDLLEQVNDAVFALDLLKNDPSIDFSKKVLVGYSWGGLAASVAAGKLSDVNCLVSLDGSEFHPYGQKDEDGDFDDLARSPSFKDLKIGTSYLRLQSAPEGKTGGKDSIYNFLPHLTGEKFVFQVDSARHEDFGSLSMVVRQAGNCPDDLRYRRISNLTTAFIDQNVKGTNRFSTVIAEELNKSITKK